MGKKSGLGWKLLVMTAVLAAMPLRESAAQAVGVVRGVVLDSTSNQPVSGAQVQVVGTNRTVATDASGGFTIPNVAEGTATLRVQRIGYSQKTASVSVQAGTTNSRDILLQPVVTTLSQVVVVGYGSRIALK